MTDYGIDPLLLIHGERGPESDSEQEMFMAAVDDEIDRIIEREGHWHVSGQYFANLEDAAIQRQRLAEATVRIAARVRGQNLRKHLAKRSA